MDVADDMRTNDNISKPVFVYNIAIHTYKFTFIKLDNTDFLICIAIDVVSESSIIN